MEADDVRHADIRVDDILVHPRDNDLIVGTHGRGIYIFDDISALQQTDPHRRGSPGSKIGIDDRQCSTNRAGNAPATRDLPEEHRRVPRIHGRPAVPERTAARRGRRRSPHPATIERRSAGPSATPASASTMAAGAAPLKDAGVARHDQRAVRVSRHENEKRLSSEVDAWIAFEPNRARRGKPESIRADNLVEPAVPTA